MAPLQREFVLRLLRSGHFTRQLAGVKELASVLQQAAEARQGNAEALQARGSVAQWHRRGAASLSGFADAWSPTALVRHYDFFFPCQEWDPLPDAGHIGMARR